MESSHFVRRSSSEISKKANETISLTLLSALSGDYDESFIRGMSFKLNEKKQDALK